MGFISNIWEVRKLRILEVKKQANQGPGFVDHKGQGFPPQTLKMDLLGVNHTMLTSLRPLSQEDSGLLEMGMLDFY